MTTKCQPLGKLKELQTNAQSDTNCSVFYFAPHSQAHPLNFLAGDKLKSIFDRKASKNLTLQS
jgi:hypothetical protein